MSDDEIAAILKNELNVSFAFQDVDKNLDRCLAKLVETKNTVTSNIDIKIRNFHVQEDAILKYRKENDLKFCEKEQDLMDKTKAYNVQIEKMKRKVESVTAQIKETQAELSIERGLAHELEVKRSALVSEEDNAVESLARTRRALVEALAWYHNYLGLTVDASDNARVTLTFVADDPLGRGRKLTIVKTIDGYLFPDGAHLSSTAEVMARLCQQRLNQKNTPVLK